MWCWRGMPQATRLISNHNTLWLMTLTSHHDSCHWFDELISFINYLKILFFFAINNDLIFHVMMTWHAIWQQGITNFQSNPWFFWHHEFLCVLNLWHQYLSWHAIIFCVSWGFWSHEFTCTCMCTKQYIVVMITILIVALKNVTHNSLTF
jgi:hypothetical protein